MVTSVQERQAKDIMPDAATLIVADGTSCRHQIHDGAQREAVHVACILERALDPFQP